MLECRNVDWIDHGGTWWWWENENKSIIDERVFRSELVDVYLGIVVVVGWTVSIVNGVIRNHY